MDLVDSKTLIFLENNKGTYRGHAWSSHCLYLQESCSMCASPRAEELSATQWWDSVELHGSVGVVGADRSNESEAWWSQVQWTLCNTHTKGNKSVTKP